MKRNLMKTLAIIPALALFTACAGGVPPTPSNAVKIGFGYVQRVDMPDGTKCYVAWTPNNSEAMAIDCK